MSAVVTLAVIGPLMAASVALLLRRRPYLRDVVTLAALVVTTALAAVLLIAVRRDGTVVVRVGGWDPELGIVLVADLFAALILVVATATILVVELFAIGQRRTPAGADPNIVGPMLLVLTGGVSLAILTGDLFTLFVAFELILVSSYVLLTHQGRRGQVRSGMTYVVINLLASTLFLLGVAYVYAATGTVNIALIAQRMPDLDTATRVGIGLWFLVVFGTKAAMFPLFSWLPDSYPTAPTTVTAVFAGLLTKIGVYVMIRFNTLTGMDDLGPLILVLAGLTMVIGVAGALAQNDVKRILSFHVVSQIGYMLMGLGLFSVAGVAGAVLFLVHQIPVKTVMFLVGGLIEDDQGSSSLDRIGGLAARRPLMALLFALPALSLAGIPPFSGFVAKLSLVDAGVAGSSYAIVTVSLVASILTLLSMSKIWLGAFWGTPTEPQLVVTDPDDLTASSRDRSDVHPAPAGPTPDPATHPASHPATDPTIDDVARSGGGTATVAATIAGTAATGARIAPTPAGAATIGSSVSPRRLMYGATALAVAGTIAVTVLAGPIWDMSVSISEDLLDGRTYISEVLG